MADASTSRRWQVFMVLGLIACVASLYFLIGGGTFAAVSGLVTISITLLNAFLSPATAKKGENWFVGAMKRTLVVGRYAKVVCVALWIAAFISAAMLAKDAYEKKYRVDIEGVVIDKLRGTPVEKALVTLKLADGASLSSEAPTGRFKFAAVDRRKVALGHADLEAVCEASWRVGRTRRKANNQHGVTIRFRDPSENFADFMSGFARRSSAVSFCFARGVFQNCF
jgi:hypothetical protein